MKSIIIKSAIVACALLVVEHYAQAEGSLSANLGAGQCDTWYYSVCNQSYVVDVSLQLEQKLSGPWSFYARIGHTSHPEGADIHGPKSNQTGSLNYGFIGIKRELFTW